MNKFIEDLWANNSPLLILLKPLSWVYWFGNRVHRFLYESGILKQTQFNIPVIVVGNIFVGGTGKTPTVIALAKKYIAEGKKVGVVSRGYGARAAHYPYEVSSDADPATVGDEPVLIAESTGAMVVCDPNRVRGVQYLVDAGCDIVISDDGLQHYRLKPSHSIVVHPAHWAGSTDLLPSGPMREPLARLEAFDEILKIDDNMRTFYCTDSDGNTIDIASLPQDLHVVVGVAQPARLFALLDSFSLRYTKHIFSDHYMYSPEDFNEIKGPVLMTSKDWVKCRRFSWNYPVFIIGYRLNLL